MLASPTGKQAGLPRKSSGAAATTIGAVLCQPLMTVMQAFLTGSLDGQLARRPGAVHTSRAAVR